MSIILLAPGVSLDLGHGQAGLLADPAGHSDNDSGQEEQGADLSLMTGIEGWWDASKPEGLIGAGGVPLTAWHEGVYGIADKAGVVGAMQAYSAGSATPQGTIYPHLSGVLGGVAKLRNAGSLMNPAIDPDFGFRIDIASFQPDSSWSWYLVWSRPNWRQGCTRDQEPVVLMSSNGVPILQADSSGTSRRLVLFPAAGGTILTGSLTRRHLHSIVLRHAPGVGLDVWLDDDRVASALTVPIQTSPAGPVHLLHDGQPSGGAQCWFHEAAYWSKALSDADVSSVLDHAARWKRGSRRGISLLVNGQSNAINFALNDGAAALLAQAVGWYTGTLAFNVIATTGSSTQSTMQSGHGIYAAMGGALPGSFLIDPATGSDPATWALGADGHGVQQALSTMSVEDRDDICAIIWPWSETDSLRTPDELNTFIGAARRFMSLERAMLDKPAAQVPLVWWNAIPYGTTGGMQMHRLAVATLASDVTANVVIGNPQTADTNARGASWDDASGASSGGDFAHRDAPDNRRLARLAAPVIARAIVRAGLSDSVATIPDVISTRGGPRIVHAYRQSASGILLTVAHDVGNDLVVPRQAAVGRGFVVMDGQITFGTGRIVNAISCERIDPTHLLLTLAEALQHSSDACGLFYPYGSFSIGRGNAVTDNYSQISVPPDWDIGKQLGGAWTLDYPLSATFTPVILSDSPE